MFIRRILGIICLLTFVATAQVSAKSKVEVIDKNICTDALNFYKTDFAGTALNSTRIAVNAAKSKGYTVNSCRQALGLAPLAAKASNKSRIEVIDKNICIDALNFYGADIDSRKRLFMSDG
jgi:hypothetical protein